MRWEGETSVSLSFYPSPQYEVISPLSTNIKNTNMFVKLKSGEVFETKAISIDFEGDYVFTSVHDNRMHVIRGDKIIQITDVMPN